MVLRGECAECACRGKGGCSVSDATQGGLLMGRKATLREESGLQSAVSGQGHARLSGSDDV